MHHHGAHYHSHGLDRTKEFLDLAAQLGGPNAVAAHPFASQLVNTPSSQLNPKRPSVHAAAHPASFGSTAGLVGGPQFPPTFAGAKGHQQAQDVGMAAPQSRSAFMRAASEVSQELHLTSQKLAALTRLVKRRGLLADPAEEIERLTSSVKGDITGLTNKLDSLQGYVQAKKEEAAHAGAVAGGKTLGGGSFTGSSSDGGASSSGGRGSTASGGADSVMNSVQGLNHGDVVLASLKGHLLTFGKSLKGILQSRAESLKSQAERRHALGAARDLGRPGVGRGGNNMAASLYAAAEPNDNSSSSSPHTALSIGNASSTTSSSSSSSSKPTTTDARARRLGGGGGVSSSSNSNASFGGASSFVGNGATATADDPFAFVTQAQLMPDAEHAYLDSRADDVQALERHIGDLGQLFSRLASVVSEQGEMVARIEDNVSSALVNIEASQNLLQRAWDRARNNGSLAVKITGIVLFFILLFVFFGT